MILSILRLAFAGLAFLAVSGTAEAAEPCPMLVQNFKASRIVPGAYECYAQRADPPTRNAQPSITDAVSGDSYDLPMR